MRALLLAIALATAAFVAPPQIAIAQSTPSPAPCTVPFIFVPLTVAQAPQVNANFSALEGCINSFSAQATPSPAATSTGCGTLTWAGTFGASDYESVLDTTACGGGGGSFTCDAAHSCVTFQTAASPAPESTDAGGNSAAVAGILQGGSLWTFGGLIARASGSMTICPNANTISCGDFIFSNATGSTVDVEQEGNFDQQGDHVDLQESGSGFNFQGTSSAPFSLELNSGEIGLTTNGEVAISGGSSGVFISSNGDLDLSASGAVNVPSVSIGNGGLLQQNADTWAGTCAMASSTTCSLPLLATYPTTGGICIATEQATDADPTPSPIAATCNVHNAGNAELIVNAASSNSETWGVMLVGNPK